MLPFGLAKTRISTDYAQKPARSLISTTPQSKVCEPYVVTLLDWTSIPAEWYITRLIVMDGDQKDTYMSRLQHKDHSKLGFR